MDSIVQCFFRSQVYDDVLELSTQGNGLDWYKMAKDQAPALPQKNRLNPLSTLNCHKLV
jgi:hypothetical protein